MLRSIGADKVVDYTQEDFSKSGERYDLILAVGGDFSIFDYKRALSPEGIYICVGGSASQYFQALLLGPLISSTTGKKLGSIGMAKPDRKDFLFMNELLEESKIVPVVDRCYPLSEVPEALRYYGEGHAQGKVVITVEHNHNK